MTRWHGHITADLQTNHHFKGHVKRRSERQADGAWKILCRLLFSICNHSAWFALSFCDAWNVVQGFVKFSGGTDVFRACEMWKVRIIFKSLFIWSQHIGSLFSASKLMHSISLCSSLWELYFSIRKILQDIPSNLSSIVCCKCFGTCAECLCSSTL